MKIKFYLTSLILIIPLFVCYSSYSFTLYGHRGARGLAPENTLPAYKVGLASRIDFVDMDVMMTKDHVVVVQHDLTLNPDITRDAKGNWVKDKNILVKNLTLQELQSYDVGRIKPNTIYATLFSSQHPVDKTHAPTLKQVIDYVKTHAGNKLGFQIEIKTDPTQADATHTPEELAAAVAKIVEQENIVNRTQVQAYDWRCLLALQKINPHIATAYITDTDQEKMMLNPDPKIAGLWTAGFLLKNYHNSIPQMVKALGGKYWDPQDAEVTAEEIQEAHKLGLKVIVWSWAERSKKDVDVSLVKKLIAIGVDGIITDRPDVVAKLK